MSTLYYGKTAETWVNDLCDEQGAAVQWQKTGSSKKSRKSKEMTCLVVCRFSEKELEASGSGSTLEEAKENASVAMLFNQFEYTLPILFALTREDVKLTSLTEYLVSLEENLAAFSVRDESDDEEVQVSDTECEGYKSGVNYIGALQEKCVEKNWQLPVYEEESRSGPSHAPSFKMMCRVGPIEKRGESKSKKEAKSMAAFKVYEALKSFNFILENISTDHSGVEESGINDIVRKMERITLNGPTSFKEEFVRAYQDIIVTYLSLHSQQPEKFNLYALTILDWICQQSGINLEFYEPLLFIDCKEGLFHSVLKIRLPFCSYSPSFVMVEGKGHSKNEAIQDCALVAMRLLIE